MHIDSMCIEAWINYESIYHTAGLKSYPIIGPASLKERFNKISTWSPKTFRDG